MAVKQTLARAPTSARLKLLGERLKDVVLQLGLVRSAIVVSVATLKRQNAELDEDVAQVLQRSAGDKIEDQIERLEELISTLPGNASRPATPRISLRRRKKRLIRP